MPNEEKSDFSAWSVPDPRPDLAFPKLTEEMVERLRPYGVEETFRQTSRFSLAVSVRSICLSCLTGKSICLFLPRVGSPKSSPIIRGSTFLVS